MCLLNWTAVGIYPHLCCASSLLLLQANSWQSWLVIFYFFLRGEGGSFMMAKAHDVTRQAWLEILSYSATQGLNHFKLHVYFPPTINIFLLLPFSRLQGALLVFVIVKFIVVRVCWCLELNLIVTVFFPTCESVSCLAWKQSIRIQFLPVVMIFLMVPNEESWFYLTILNILLWIYGNHQNIKRYCSLFNDDNRQ